MTDATPTPAPRAAETVTAEQLAEWRRYATPIYAKNGGLLKPGDSVVREVLDALLIAEATIAELRDAAVRERTLRQAALHQCLSRLPEDWPIRTSFDGWVEQQARDYVRANPDEYEDDERDAILGTPAASGPSGAETSE